MRLARTRRPSGEPPMGQVGAISLTFAFGLKKDSSILFCWDAMR